MHFILLVLLAAGLLALAGCAPPQQPLPLTVEPTVRPTAMGNASSGPTFQEIRAAIAHIWRTAQAAPTPASASTAEAYEQQHRYEMETLISGLKGKEVQGWQGWVVESQEDDSGHYLIAIDMDELYDNNPFLTFEYRAVRRIGLADVLLTDVSPEQAKSVSAGHRVLLSGIIKDLSGWRDEELAIDPANGRLAVIIEHSGVEAVAEDDKAAATDTKNVVITLSRPICGMGPTRCYMYDLIVHGNGKIIYSEADWETMDDGSKILTKTYQVSEESIRDLVAEFERIDYFSLKDDYDGYDASDAPAATTSITSGTKRKSIFHYYGDDEAPDALSQLENKIDALVASKQPTVPAVPTSSVKWKTRVEFNIEIPATPTDRVIRVGSEDTWPCQEVSGGGHGDTG